MKLHHAAVVFSVGWYLMTPPHLSPTEWDIDAPLSRWSVASEFDTAEDCKQTQETTFNEAFQAEHEYQASHPEISDREALSQLPISQCVATDDPRLNEQDSSGE